MKDRHVKSETLGYPEYAKAVHNILHECMRVKHGDQLVIITDEPREDIGLAIYQTAVKLVPTKLLRIEDFVERPAKSFPEALQKEIKEFRPTASIYAATGQEGELEEFRQKLIGFLTDELKLRHGHMISVDSRIMLDSMSKDYKTIYKTTHALYNLLKDAKEMRVTDPHGTDLTVTFSPKLRWNASDGVPTPGQWTNLPDGEVFTCPETANGVVVAWEVGDYFSDKYGLLKDPVRLTIVNSRVEVVECADKDLERELTAYLKTEEHSSRMGEFAVGCLLGLEDLIGNLLQDEKFPGIHMAFGHPYPKFTGQEDWNAETHVDVIPLHVDAWVDGKILLKEGKFYPSALYRMGLVE